MKLGATALSNAFLQSRIVPGCPIIDVHAHPLPFGGAYLPCAPLERFAESLKRNGVRLCIIASHKALCSPTELDTDWTSLAINLPEQVRIWYVFNPRYDYAGHAMTVFNLNRNILAGFKIHPDMHGAALSSNGYESLFAQCEEQGLPVLSHTWAGSQFSGKEELGIIMCRHPALFLLAGHSLCNDWEAACGLANEFPNFYLELTAAGAIKNSLETMVNNVGSTRILFGTDLPWFSTMHGIGSLLSADITDEDRRNILYRNAVRIFSRFEWWEKSIAALG